MAKIIIAPNNFKKELIKKYRKDNPFFDIYIYSKEELIDLVYPFLKKESVYLLIKEFNLSYKSALKYSYFLRFVDYSNEALIKELKPFYEYLKKQNCFLYDEYGKNIVMKKSVDVFGYYKEDYLLEKIFKTLQITPNFHDFNINLDSNKVHIYDTIEEEVHHLFIKILDLINDNVDINDIYIYGYNKDYEFYFDYYSKLYGINFNNLPLNKFKQLNFVKTFLKDFQNGLSLDDCFNNLSNKNISQDIFEKFQEIILTNHYDDLNLNQQLDVFNNVLNVEVEANKFDNAVTILNNVSNFNNKHVFCIGFNQSNYPKIVFDNDLIFDSDKEILSLLTSKQENIINRKSLLEFLSSNNCFYYSFSSKSYLDNYYLSFLASAYNFKLIKQSELSYDYCNLASLNSVCKIEDLHYKFNKDDFYLNSYRQTLNYKYNSYDNSFKKFSLFDKDSLLKYSYSSLNKYALCPFSYYVDEVLKLQVGDPSFYATIGSFVHSIYEIGLRYNLTFDDAYQRCLNNGQFNFDIKEKFILSGLFQRIKDIYNFNQEQLLKINNHEIFLEKWFTYQLNQYSIINGKIDKIIVVDNQYYFIVDYKTGSKPYKEGLYKYGIDLQLPVYSLLTYQDDLFKDVSLAGIYYQEIFNDIKDNDTKNFKLSGLSLNNTSYWNLIDADNYIKNPKKNSCSEDKFIDNINLTKEKYLNFDDKIRNNIFDIYPILSNKNKENIDACTYCKNKDICFVKYQQKRIVANESEE